MVTTITHRFRRTLEAVAPWAGWALTLAGLGTFVSVLLGWVLVGDAKPATLLVAADLFVSGIGTVRADDAADDEP